MHWETIFLVFLPFNRNVCESGGMSGFGTWLSSFLSGDLLQGSGFIVHLLRPQGLTITGS